MEKDAAWARQKQHRPKTQEQKEINELCADFKQTYRYTAFVFTTEFMQVISQVLLQMTVFLTDKYSSNDTAKSTDNFF